MFISDYAIKRPLITVVAMLALVVFGLFALFNLKTDEFPEVTPPFVSVSLIYPGASPDGVEGEVLDPVEEQIRSIAGVKQVMGKAYDGYAVVNVEFEFGKNLTEATQEIRDGISAVRNDLPVELEEPVIRKLNDTDVPIISFALSSTSLSPSQLTQLADPGITSELRSVAGVGEVLVSGKQERELTVELRPNDLQATGVSVAEVVQALSLQNLAAPVGRVTGGLEERSIRLRGRLQSPDEFEQLVVAERGGTLVRLGQVADVRDGAEEPRSVALYNTSEAVGIDIKKAQGYSTTDVSARVQERVAAIQKRLPAGTRFELVQDAGERVTASVSNVQSALLEGAALTVLVVFLFLNSWRSTVITGLALPVSVLASFIAVWALGFRLETMSLLGLSLAIGILIDDAIVVRENIVRHVEMGKDHFTAAKEGTDEIGLAVAATTFSILAVFVPIGFMPGMGGEWFKPFALTIACAVLVSLFVSFSLDPMLSAYWPDPHKEEHEKGWVTRKLDTFNAWFNRQAEGYRRVIAWALDHRKSMVALALAAFVGALAMPATGLVEGGFFPEDDRAEFNMRIETPPGSSLEYTRLKAEELIRVTRAHPEVRYTYATLGADISGAVDVGNVYVRLVPPSARDKSAEEVAAELRGEAGRIGGMTTAVFTSGFGGGIKQLQFQLRGADIDALTRAANMVVGVMREVPGTVDIGLSTKGQKPELEVELERGVAGALGISVGQIAQSLRPAFAGIDAGDWTDPSGEQRDVVVRLSPEARRRASDLEALPLVVAGPNGLPTTLPLGQVATIRESDGPAVIDHLDGELVVTVEANVSGRGSGDVTNDIRARLEDVQLPPGVRWSLGGESEDQAEVFGQIFAALGAAILLMYLILVVQFGSFLDPLAILISLPLSLIGVMLALFLTDNTLNIMSMIAIILLAGIVAKNAILLIDFAKWARERDGMPLREALIEAGAIRLRPIIMTTVALVAGMLPVALGAGEGAQFRAPLGIAVIGGVITSTLLTLLVIPTFYEIMDGWRTSVSRRLGLRVTQFTGEHRIPGDLSPEAGD